MSLRRRHKKSRLGCQECKRRHVKCDESRPTCAQCVFTCRTCVYQQPPSRKIQSASSPVPLTQASPAATTETSTPFATTTVPSPFPVDLLPQASTPSTFAVSVGSSSIPATSAAQHGAVYPPLNMRHMELFHHFIFETGPSLDDGNSPQREPWRIITSGALCAPYLMHQILALSALHLSHTRTDQTNFYREEATTLQTQALCLFNNDLGEVTSGNCVPLLVFTSILGLHALAEAVVDLPTNADAFLDKFVTYLNLHRGVRAVTERSWSFLMQSNISPILGHAQRSIGNVSIISPGCSASIDQLYSLLDHTDMGIESKTACHDAISRLKLLYQSEPSAGEVHQEDQQGDQQSTNLVWAWPILLSSVYTDLLMKRRPEALIILCHYAVLLHQRRKLWFVGDAGRMLIEAVTRSLGTYWRHCLDWPNQILEGATM